MSLASTADRQLVRAINRTTVLRLIRLQGPTSRASLAKATGLSQVTVGAIVSELVDRGLVSEGAQLPSTGGRPATLLTLNQQSYFAAGIKLMEDHLVGAVTDLEAEVLAEGEEAFTGSTPEAVLGAAAGLVARLFKDADLDRRRLLGVGIGMAGVIDGEQGVCRYSPFLGWRDVALADLGEAAIGAPVLLDNDVNTLALAERWFGVGGEVDDFLLVTLGRGVGLGIVADGRLHRGHQGGAGELGHTVVDENDQWCPCGNVGCLEATVAEPALLGAAQDLIGHQEGRSLQTPEDLYDLARVEPVLGELLGGAGRMLGRGLANLVNLFAPELIILSGEGIRAGELLLAPLRQELDARVFSGLRNTYQLVVEPLPDAAWARGAASLVLGEIFEFPTRARTDLLWSREAAS